MCVCESCEVCFIGQFLMNQNKKEITCYNTFDIILYLTKLHRRMQKPQLNAEVLILKYRSI